MTASAVPANHTSQCACVECKLKHAIQLGTCATIPGIIPNFEIQHSQYGQLCTRDVLAAGSMYMCQRLDTLQRHVTVNNTIAFFFSLSIPLIDCSPLELPPALWALIPITPTSPPFRVVVRRMVLHDLPCFVWYLARSWSLTPADRASLLSLSLSPGLLSARRVGARSEPVLLRNAGALCWLTVSLGPCATMPCCECERH